MQIIKKNEILKACKKAAKKDKPFCSVDIQKLLSKSKVDEINKINTTYVASILSILLSKKILKKVKFKNPDNNRRRCYYIMRSVKIDI